jgi:hypothetical protein
MRAGRNAFVKVLWGLVLVSLAGCRMVPAGWKGYSYVASVRRSGAVEAFHFDWQRQPGALAAEAWGKEQKGLFAVAFDSRRDLPGRLAEEARQTIGEANARQLGRDAEKKEFFQCCGLRFWDQRDSETILLDDSFADMLVIRTGSNGETLSHEEWLVEADSANTLRGLFSRIFPGRECRGLVPR